MKVLGWTTLLLGAALSIFALTTMTDPTSKWLLFAAGAVVAVSSAWTLGYAGGRRVGSAQRKLPPHSEELDYRDGP